MALSPAARLGLAALLCTTSACTQPPASIEMHGTKSFGRNGSSYSSTNTSTVAAAPYGSVSSSSISSNDLSAPSASSGSKTAYQPAPVYTNTPAPQQVSRNSIGSTDLAPPPLAVAKAPEAKPVVAATTPAKPAAPSKLESVAKAKVNPWTGKTRDDFASDNTGMDDTTAQPVQLANAEERTEPKPLLEKQTTTQAADKNAGYIWPVNSRKIISGFGAKGDGKVNDGINIAISQGEPVWAAADGEVVYVGNEIKGYGNMVLLKHSGNKNTSYAHLSKLTVEKYARVKQGQIIGYVGATGNVNKSQLHFAIRDGKEAVDPQKMLARDVAGL